MRIQIGIALVLSLAAGQQNQRGIVSSVTATADVSVGTMQFVVRGTNPCGAVNLDYGDGIAITYAIHEVPVSQMHEYTRVGDYTVQARGMGNCDGRATTTVRITVVRPQPPPPPPPPPARAEPPAIPRPAIRFVGMDQNRDNVIAGNEWRGSTTSFAVHDWNGDGRLSGEEVRLGALPPARTDRGRQTSRFSDWTEAQFRQIDRNRDNRVSRGEWRFDLEDFIRGDRNGDNALSLDEFLIGDIDDDRGDRFDDLDLNQDNRVDRNEWHGGLDAFRWLDRNNDGVLSRLEVVGDDRSSPAQIAGQGGGRNTGAGGGAASAGVATIAVSSRQTWTDTGITVRAGDLLMIRASGTIQFSSKSSDVAGPDGARGRRATDNAPLRDVVIGALIGRIGDSEPFLVGADSQGLRAPRDGRLYLRVNDDVLGDNRGEFRVTRDPGRGGRH